MLPVGERFLQETKYARDGELPATRVLKVPDEYKEYSGVPVFFLPDPETTGGAPLWDVVRQRRSVRRYSQRPMDLKELSQLLWATQGVTGRVGGFALRASPSAGALYPIETYLWVRNVEGLSKGIYHYHPLKACLELLEGGDFSYALTQACLGQGMLATCSVAFIWTAVVDRCRIKYGERAFRYIFLDAAHICQNLYLASCALGFGCCAIGAFYDDEINGIIGVDGQVETVIYLATVGPLK